MNRILGFFCIAVFSIFFGSQITEGCLLVPYWKTLPAAEFYEYYSRAGLTIGRYYTSLTVIAALIPIGISGYCFHKKSAALSYALLASFFTFLGIALFYGYFKDINQQFLEGSLQATQLKTELQIWGYWHWTRVVLELLALIFLVLTFNILIKKKN